MVGCQSECRSALYYFYPFSSAVALAREFVLYWQKEKLTRWKAGEDDRRHSLTQGGSRKRAMGVKIQLGSLSFRHGQLVELLSNLTSLLLRQASSSYHQLIFGFASDCVFVKLNQNKQILRRQCCQVLVIFHHT